MSQTGRFSGKVDIVTGATSGIGRATARAFAAEGASVVVADVAADGARERSRREVRRKGSRPTPATQLARHEGVTRMSVVIVGAGPNLGAAIARRFGGEGLPVGLVARNRDKLETLARDLEGEGIKADLAPADIRDATALAAAIASLADRLGPVEVLEYSPVPAGEFMKPILETTVDDVRATVEFSVLGAVAAATAVLPAMLDRGSGTILFTTGGAAINPNPQRAGVGVSFAGEVAYARMLHDGLRDRGIHVGHTAIGGSIAPGGDHEPDDVAEVLWRHHTERSEFQVRLGMD